MNFDVSYGITRRIAGRTLASVREGVTAALKEEGFGILTEIDVQGTLEKKLGIHMGAYVILGACNPKLAHAALTKEPATGLLLPCNVVVAEDGGDVVLSAASPRAMFAIVGASAAGAIAPIVEEAEASLRRALDKVSVGSAAERRTASAGA
jgi:uncharacterized protein (DUF302 family)